MTWTQVYHRARFILYCKIQKYKTHELSESEFILGIAIPGLIVCAVMIIIKYGVMT